MSRDLKGQLHQLRNQLEPDHDWVLRNRDVLLQQMRNTTGERSANASSSISIGQIIGRLFQAVRIFVPEKVFVLSRSAGLVTLAALVAVSGWIASVNAAYDSLPGEALYNVKLATEKTELIVASVVGNDTDRVTTILRHASHRVEEYQKSKTSAQATQAIQSLTKSIETTNQSLGNSATTPASATAVAKVVNEKTDQLLRSLEAASTTVSGVDVDGKNIQTSALQKQVGEATHLIEVTGVKAVQVLAEKTLAGDQTVNQNEVKASVEKKLDKIATDITGLNNDVKGVVAIASSSTSQTALPPVTASLPSAAPSTTAVTAGQVMKTTEQKMGEVNKIVEKTVAEAKTMIDNNDLLGALKKVEALTEVKKDAGTAVIEAKIITGAIGGGASLGATGSSTMSNLSLPTVSSSLQSNSTGTVASPKLSESPGVH